MVSASSSRIQTRHKIDIPGIFGRDIKCMDTEQAVPQNKISTMNGWRCDKRSTLYLTWLALPVLSKHALVRCGHIITHFKERFRPYGVCLLNTNIRIKQPANSSHPFTNDILTPTLLESKPTAKRPVMIITRSSPSENHTTPDAGQEVYL